MCNEIARLPSSPLTVILNGQPLAVTPEIMDLHARVTRLDVMGFSEAAQAMREIMQRRIADANAPKAEAA